MKLIHIIIIAAVSLAIFMGLMIGFGMKNFSAGGNIGVIEINHFISSAKYIVKDLKNFKEDPSIKAVIIRVDSPGGIVASSWEIYDGIKKLKEEMNKQ